MKRTLLWFGLLVVALPASIELVWERTCRLEPKCENCPGYSLDEQASRRAGWYVCHYRPVQNRIVLRHWQDTLWFADGWCERAWYRNTDICRAKRDLPLPGYTACLPVRQSGGDFVVGMNRLVDTGIRGSGYGREVNTAHASLQRTDLPALLDTIRFVLFEKDPDLAVGWSKGGRRSDTVAFFRTE